MEEKHPKPERQMDTHSEVEGSSRTRSAAWTVLLMAVVATSSVTIAGCGRDGFECGVAAATGDDAIRRCDGAAQTCICATHSCARVDTDPPSDGATTSGTSTGTGDSTSGADGDFDDECAEERSKGHCDSGYRYLSQPFASRQWACKCVLAADIEAKVDANAENPRCPDADTTTTGTTTTTTTSTSTATGAGGATGGGGSGVSASGGTGGGK